jgi:hypothetical protein
VLKQSLNVCNFEVPGFSATHVVVSNRQIESQTESEVKPVRDFDVLASGEKRLLD